MAAATTQVNSYHMAKACKTLIQIRGVISYPAGDGDCTVEADVNGITAAVASGVTTLAFPTGVAGTLLLQLLCDDTVNTVELTTFDATTGAATFTTRTDGEGAANPTAAGKIHFLLLIREGADY